MFDEIQHIVVIELLFFPANSSSLINETRPKGEAY